MEAIGRKRILKSLLLAFVGLVIVVLGTLTLLQIIYETGLNGTWESLAAPQ